MCVCMHVCFLACMCMGFLSLQECVCVCDGTMIGHITDYKLIDFQLFNHELFINFSLSYKHS